MNFELRGDIKTVCEKLRILADARGMRTEETKAYRAKKLYELEKNQLKEAFEKAEQEGIL